MYESLPRRERFVLKLMLVLSWLTAGAGGFAGAFLSPNTIVSELSPPVVMTFGIVLIVSTVVAATGVVMNRYRFEWIAGWGAALAIAPYGLTVWWLVATETPTRLMQALLVTSLGVFFLTRAARGAAHAARIRRAAERAVKEVADELLPGGDQ